MATPVMATLVTDDAPVTALAVNAQAALAHYAPAVKENMVRARSANTIRSYRSSYRAFEAWCRQEGVSALPASAEAIAAYITARQEELRPSSICQHLAAIGKVHRWRGFANPIRDNEHVAEVLRGIKNTFGMARNKKAPVCEEDLRVLLRFVPAGIVGLRDRALLLLGFAGAFRRSELVALNIEDLTFTPEGLGILIQKSKTDQTGEGQEVAITWGKHDPTCAVKALQAWLTGADIQAGPIFFSFHRGGHIRRERLTGYSVALLIKKYCALAGLDPKRFSGHSLRCGFVTSTAQRGVALDLIMATTRHKGTAIVVQYIRRANQFRENALRSLDL